MPSAKTAMASQTAVAPVEKRGGRHDVHSGTKKPSELLDVVSCRDPDGLLQADELRHVTADQEGSVGVTGL